MDQNRAVTKTLRLDAHVYRNFPADYSLDVPAEGFGGWTTVPVELPLAETALVSMHAWDYGTRERFPTLYATEEYVTRARAILRSVFPPLLAAARGAGLTVLHVVGGGDYYKDLPAYRRAAEMAGAAPEFVGEAPHSDANIAFRRLKADLARPVPKCAGGGEGEWKADFAPEARPMPGEGVAENADQLSALCREAGVSHLVYIGFYINWCLLTSAGGMRDMARRWYFCSTIRDATTAVENKESARTEAFKEEALWRVATGYGFVFDSAPFIVALRAARTAP
jgi:nicotinamidase-related amidase